MKHLPRFARQINDSFIGLLERAVALHDLGKIVLPDHILMKPGKLDPDERLVMQTHTTIGAETLDEIVQLNGFIPPFFPMAVEIAKHHHERFDGTGYPDRLSGDNIPLSARIVAVADSYDALRCRRAYRPALTHGVAVTAILEGSPGSYDPDILVAFGKCHNEFEKIYKQLHD
jgi:response regulator RpfG family c-di-GMP phosphodiesterase